MQTPLTGVQREALDAPFDPSQIQTKPGGGKRPNVQYVDHTAVTRRLNEVLGHYWSYECIDYLVEGETVIVHGRLIVHFDAAPDIVKSEWGGHEKGMGDLSDKFKAAASDALKKCASRLGIALHLWEGTPTGTARSGTSASQPIGQATQGQIDLIKNLGRSPLLNEAEWQHLETQVAKGLDKRQASELIDKAKSRMDARRKADASPDAV